MCTQIYFQLYVYTYVHTCMQDFPVEQRVQRQRKAHHDKFMYIRARYEFSKTYCHQKNHSWKHRRKEPIGRNYRGSCAVHTKAVSTGRQFVFRSLLPLPCPTRCIPRSAHQKTHGCVSRQWIEDCDWTIIQCACAVHIYIHVCVCSCSHKHVCLCVWYVHTCVVVPVFVCVYVASVYM